MQNKIEKTNYFFIKTWNDFSGSYYIGSSYHEANAKAIKENKGFRIHSFENCGKLYYSGQIKKDIDIYQITIDTPKLINETWTIDTIAKNIDDAIGIAWSIFRKETKLTAKEQKHLYIKEAKYISSAFN